MSKTTVAEIETAVAAAEAAIATYTTEKAAIRARRDAGELTFPAAEKERLRASIPADRAVKALRALAGAGEIDGIPSDDLMARADAVDGWRE